MKRAYRLRRPDQFRRARREGRSYTTPLLLLNVVSGRRRRTRCGFIVAKQIGGAVQRNRARRRIREAVRLALPAIVPGYDMVFVARSPEVLNAAFSTLQATVEQLLRRAQIWSDPGTAQPTTDHSAGPPDPLSTEMTTPTPRGRGSSPT